MIIDGKKFRVKNTYDSFITVPDCWVVNNNKLGSGNGEAKIYLGSKEYMREFYGGEGFVAEVIMLKTDLITYMEAIKSEYYQPSQHYRAVDTMPQLWQERMDKIKSLEDIILFRIYDQNQIVGSRGYVNTNDAGYQLIREIALPLVSFISSMELGYGDRKLYYWRLFADFEAILDLTNGPLVFKYGQGGKQTISEQKLVKKDRKTLAITQARAGQGKYREELLQECPYCPISKINDERLLIASHIKPWIVSDDREKIDPKNGIILSPLYDKLFDRGFITFSNERRIILSDWISPQNYKRMGLANNVFYQHLPLDDKRCEYLSFHRETIFRGIID